MTLGARRLQALLLGGLTTVVLLALLWLLAFQNPAPPVSIVLDSLRVDWPDACGNLQVAVIDPRGGHRSRQSSRFVNGRSYSGMEDNDLRGFLDGGFRYGWNQPGQIHVRTGRKATPSGFGEPELFRIIQRWDSLGLPPSARVERVVLTLHLEHPPEFSGKIYLYEVKRAWNPGGGGTLQDNVSPPKTGEAWWNAAEQGRDPWALPGVGFAHRSDPDADTDIVPLASSFFGPDSSRVTFQSGALAQYVDRRARAALPLQFLIKVSDGLEDVPGTRLYFYSGNEGHSRDSSRRPSLMLEWTAPARLVTQWERIHLERERSMVLAPGHVEPGDWVAVGWTAEPGCIEPTAGVRFGPSRLWTDASLPVQVPRAGGQMEVRIRAALDPVPLGDSFVAELKDTWVISAPPEHQHVEWTFVSPTGAVHQRNARYIGDNRWEVTFTPSELGPWRYSWEQSFAEAPYEGARAVFDAVATEIEPVLSTLRNLAEEIETARPQLRQQLLRHYSARVSRLERAAVGLLGPDGMASEEGQELKRLLNRIRGTIAGRPIPTPIPLNPIRPPDWASRDHPD